MNPGQLDGLDSSPIPAHTHVHERRTEKRSKPSKPSTEHPTAPHAATPAEAYVALREALREAHGAPCQDRRGGDLWFSIIPADQAAALTACTTCPVLAHCASYADVADERWGVWGGTTPTDRRRANERGQG